ncbi:MAG: AAA family ATPase [Bacteroides sp.]|nr:AAA family ATPase [Bacteroides sp.]MCM1086240.1 AAA family ATPase [Bacteroides sp.]
MLEWKAESNGQYALLIEGARRVGKSTIVEEFARNEYENHIVIDFSTATHEIIELFDHISDLNLFFLGLQTLSKKTLQPRKSVIVFDEVQFCPKARQAIKHLVKDGRFDYIETGSLISIKKNVQDILIPSEEHRICMYPMDFEEFLWAIDKATAFDLIRYCYEKLEPLGDAMNRSLMRDFRLYMLVGGMPQAVNAYIETNNFAKVDNVKRKILDLYDADFRKIDTLGRASTIFNHIPAELNRNVMRYKVGSVIEGSKPARLGELFADIADSKTVNFAFHANDPGIGLAFHANFDFFKLFLADTGLFVSLVFKDKNYTDNEIYRKLLFDKLPTDLGYIYENAVAQQLICAGHALYYYTFKETSPEGSSRSYEIDFLISRKDKICPIEIKSSGYKSHKSLDKFREKYSSRIQTCYLLYTKDIRKEQDIICLPVYMAGLL